MSRGGFRGHVLCKAPVFIPLELSMPALVGPVGVGDQRLAQLREG